MTITTLAIYESDRDDPDYNGSDEDPASLEEGSIEENECNGDKSRDYEDNSGNGDERENGSNEAGDDDGDGEAMNEVRRNKVKRKREKSEDEAPNKEKRERKAKQKESKDEDEDDIVERFELEIEESVANWFDEFRIKRNIIPKSSDEEEDLVAIRDRHIRMGTNDKLAIGRTFFSGFEFKEAVLHHALRSRENIKQDRWGKENISFSCAQDKDCGWRVYCSLDKTRQLWVLRSKCGYHRCTPNGKCKLLKSHVIGKLFLNKLRMQPQYMPLDIQRHMKEQWNILSYIGQVHRGRLLALKWLQEEYALHFAHLRGYTAEIIDSNPGSTAIVDTIPNAVLDDQQLCFDNQTCRSKSSWEKEGTEE